MIRRYQKADKMTKPEAELAFGRFRRIPLHISGFRDLIDRAWQLGGNVTILDGVYVALAENLDCDFVTRDGRLSTAPGIRCPIIVPDR